MDENYLDSLLNEISLDNEIETSEKTKSKRPDKAAQSTVAFDHDISEDSKTQLSSGDDISGTSEFDELDELDKMADFDFSDLDFDDLDFDDLDMLNTKSKEKEPQIHEAFKPSEEPVGNADSNQDMNLNNLAIDDAFFDTYKQEDQSKTAMSDNEQQPKQDIPESNTDIEPENDANMDTDDFLSNFSQFEDNLSEVQAAAPISKPEDKTGTPAVSDMRESIPEPEGDLDELLSMLGIEDEDKSMSDNEEQKDTDQLEVPDKQEEVSEHAFSEDLNDILEMPENAAPKQHPLLQLLFGSDEEEEPEMSEEELAAIKAEKKAKRDAKKAERKAKADEKKAAKSAKDAAADSEKAAKKALKAAKRKKENEAAEPEKKLNKHAVIIVFVFFATILAVVVLGTNTFNYKLVIRKAANYFERQKYHMAYDEIAGVDVKKEDKPLEDKIYTVMYVERLYESYDINAKLGRMDKALDCLLRGLVKYDEHYAEAQELGIVADIDSSRAKITDALQSVYGLSVEDGYAILALDNRSYWERLQQYVQPSADESIVLD